MTSCEPESPLVPSTTTTTNGATDGLPTSSCSKRTGGIFSKPGFVTQMQKHKVRTVKTLCLYLAYTALGMATGMSGPTILDLQLTVDSTYEQITFILPGRSLGYALGSFIGKCVQLSTLSSSSSYLLLLRIFSSNAQKYLSFSLSWFDVLLGQHSTFNLTLLRGLSGIPCHPSIQSYSVRVDRNLLC